MSLFPIVTDRSHIAPVPTREELIYLLSRACELEHGVACIYLFAAYSLKSDASEGGMTAGASRDGASAGSGGWSRSASRRCCTLRSSRTSLTAIGGAPHFRRTNFPVPRSALPIDDHMTLEPFSLETIERFMCVEMPEAGILPPDEQAEAEAVPSGSRRGVGAQVARPNCRRTRARGCEPFDIDFATQGEFYHKIMSGFACIPEQELFIGPPEAQANARFIDFAGKLLSVVDRASARASDADGDRAGRGADHRRIPTRTFGSSARSGASTSRR